MSFIELISISEYVKDDKNPDCIAKIENISYSDFFKDYLINNKPCLIKNISEFWKCSKDWVHEGKPDFQYLSNKYGGCNVPVTKCGSSYNNYCKESILFDKYIDYWTNRSISDKEDPVYLKDWHLRKQYPSDKFYNVPKYFASDWLNEYSIDNDKDDFMFVYMGPQGSWTPFHADVYSSFSWSVNVVGKKRWLLFPPGEEMKFVDSMGNFPYNIEDSLSSGHKHYEIIQNPGEAIFVPSGWFHQVINLEDTISVNHNWINGCNVRGMWLSLKKNLESVEKEISEFKSTEGWEEHCQVMLKALFGLNVNGFVEFIKYITNKRLKSLKDDKYDQVLDSWHIGKNHIFFDLQSLKILFEDMISEKTLGNIITTQIESLILQINNNLKYIQSL